MGVIDETIEIEASPETVWAIAGDVGNVAVWCPGIQFVQMHDDIRIAKFTDGRFVVERIVSRSDADRRFTYVIIGGEFPVENYRSDLEVESLGSGSKVRWGATFKAVDSTDDRHLTSSISATYKSGLEALRKQSAERGKLM